ncbi:RHS repeat-associated core domain protein containing protein [Pseudomonas sp. GM50]|uniref:RHS repeat-associated core domain-containing protein n=1 Tax=Pseudomonas sp. GM50 TaxID=1144332 RepID=UPI000270C783|nr:RHS repeat-associated core domain-containing protein [Pseudomonas sp. GM50]EJM65723.1 RHS repeat-associated core domain protein containing protein [Pseudomonas sp. GM50]
MNAQVHRHTPALAVIDSRGLPVRQVAYLRRVASDQPAARITRRQHDAQGRWVSQQDPRLAAPNQTRLYGVGDAVLLQDSVDSGWQLRLFGSDGQSLEHWDGRGVHGTVDYDPQRRPIARHEQMAGQPGQTIEYLTYGNNAAGVATHNQCGQLIRHDDSGGTLLLHDYSMQGASLLQTRHFLKALTLPDWPIAVEARNDLLEPGDGFSTAHLYTASGEQRQQIDAAGHCQRWRFDRAGQLQQVGLQPKGASKEQCLLHSVDYSAEGQIQTQAAGNGVLSHAEFDPADGNLTHLSATRPGRGLLQDLSYAYDGVGNVLIVTDHTLTPQFFANRRVDGISHLFYDSLSQLIRAEGREAHGQSIRPELPDLLPNPGDSSRWRPYTEHYDYDEGGNLTLLRHDGHQPHRRAFNVADESNRALPWDEQTLPDLANGFDRNGNLQRLHPHQQTLQWNGQNQLQSLTLVSRAEAEDDVEQYVYDHQRLRIRKQQRTLASGVTHVREVRYLPGLEIRTRDEREQLQVISIQAGHQSVRCLHWVSGQPAYLDNDQLRYSLDDHLGSSSLELDQQAELISHEGYYPYGGTAWWAARSEVEADYKTVRYSGKERDSSGLYDYGLRYYAPWLCRWLNPDPAGDVDGLNVYRMVRNSPVVFIDDIGEASRRPNENRHPRRTTPSRRSAPTARHNVERDQSPDGLPSPSGSENSERIEQLRRQIEDLDRNRTTINPASIGTRMLNSFYESLASRATTKLMALGGTLGGIVGATFGGFTHALAPGLPMEITASSGTAMGAAIGGYVAHKLSDHIKGRVIRHLERKLESLDGIELPDLTEAGKQLNDFKELTLSYINETVRSEAMSVLNELPKIERLKALKAIQAGADLVGTAIEYHDRLTASGTNLQSAASTSSGLSSSTSGSHLPDFRERQISSLDRRLKRLGGSSNA